MCRSEWSPALKSPYPGLGYGCVLTFIFGVISWLDNYRFQWLIVGWVLMLAVYVVWGWVYRLQARCPDCGFDMILFLENPRQCGQFWRQNLSKRITHIILKRLPIPVKIMKGQENEIRPWFDPVVTQYLQRLAYFQARQKKND